MLDAVHAEYGEAGTQVITLLACSLMDQRIQIAIVPGSRLAALYGGSRCADERTTCNYGLAPELQDLASEHGGEQNAIVGEPWLRSDNRNGVTPKRTLGEFVD